MMFNAVHAGETRLNETILPARRLLERKPGTRLRRCFSREITPSETMGLNVNLRVFERVCRGMRP
jgi:hypothetical protein